MAACRALLSVMTTPHPPPAQVADYGCLLDGSCTPPDGGACVPGAPEATQVTRARAGLCAGMPRKGQAQQLGRRP